MDIDLGQDVSFNVKYNGQAYVLREPTVRETQGLKLAQEQDDLAVIRFLSSLGLPEDVALNMPITKMKKLVEGMVGAISEKK